MKELSLLSLLLLLGIATSGCTRTRVVTFVPNPDVVANTNSVPTSSLDQMKEKLEQPLKPTISKEKPRSNRTEKSEIKAIERKGVSISRLVRPDEAINELRQSSRFEAPPRFILDTGIHNRVSMHSQPSSKSGIIADISDRREVQVISARHIDDYYETSVTKKGKSITGYIKIGATSCEMNEAKLTDKAADCAQLRRITSGSNIDIHPNGDDDMWRDDETGTHIYRIETQTKESSKIYKSPNSNSGVVTEISDGARIFINKNIFPVNGFYSLEGIDTEPSGWIKIN